MPTRLPAAVALLVTIATLVPSQANAQSPTREEAIAAMHRAVRFFRTHCSAGGGYIFRLSADLKKREGEGKVGNTTAWLQPPGTPSVGMAYTTVFQLTQDQEVKEAALATAQALIQGQLQSGGWYHRIDFAPEDRARFAYRVDDVPSDNRRQVNQTTFDDDKSQSAARFLMHLDHTLNFQQPAVHEAATYAVDAFVKAQYANGAWPQRYTDFPDPQAHQPRQASIPKNWSRTYPKRDYKGDYTLNDNSISDVITTMLLAWDIYGKPRYFDAACHGGDFFLLAQLPAPQPGWAQQYNDQMQPAWARKFEPPAVTGGESQGVLRTLLLLYQRTGKSKFLTPIPSALAYYRSSQLPSGKLARFYELGTNKPLYFTKDYQLTYSDADMPTHYSFQVGSNLARIQADYDKLAAGKKQSSQSDIVPKRQPPAAPDVSPSKSLTLQAAACIQALDERGAWVEAGRMRHQGDSDDTTDVIESRTFCRNLVILARYIAASAP